MGRDMPSANLLTGAWFSGPTLRQTRKPTLQSCLPTSTMCYAHYSMHTSTCTCTHTIAVIILRKCSDNTRWVFYILDTRSVIDWNVIKVEHSCSILFLYKHTMMFNLQINHSRLNNSNGIGNFESWVRVHTHSPATQEAEEDLWSPQVWGQHRQHRLRLAKIITTVIFYWISKHLIVPDSCIFLLLENKANGRLGRLL